MSADKFWSYFYEIYEAIPRQGPGDRESTQRALRLLPPLTRSQRILDIGCSVTWCCPPSVGGRTTTCHLPTAWSASAQRTRLTPRP